MKNDLRMWFRQWTQAEDKLDISKLLSLCRECDDNDFEKYIDTPYNTNNDFVYVDNFKEPIQPLQGLFRRFQH